jgi:hypothetical protein
MHFDFLILILIFWGGGRSGEGLYTVIHLLSVN